MSPDDDPVVELDDLLVRPGTYFNPQTEVLVVVDDSSSLDHEIFNMEVYEGAEWVRLSDEVPIDEEGRDEQLEIFQTHYHPGTGAVTGEEADEQLDHVESPGDGRTIVDPDADGDDADADGEGDGAAPEAAGAEPGEDE